MWIQVYHFIFLCSCFPFPALSWVHFFFFLEVLHCNLSVVFWAISLCIGFLVAALGIAIYILNFSHSTQTQHFTTSNEIWKPYCHVIFFPLFMLQLLHIISIYIEESLQMVLYFLLPIIKHILKNSRRVVYSISYFRFSFFIPNE